MKHGLKLRKLQRTSSHRQALLRNLVTSLLHHEVIKTTVPKAKEAARMAEKIITLGKKGTNPSLSKAQAYLMPPHHYAESSTLQAVPPTPAPGVDPARPPKTLLHKLFNELAERYAERPGGYTRITKFGRRPGDHAPVALVSLVDGPRDIKFEMTARTLAREAAVHSRENPRDDNQNFTGTRKWTKMNVDKVLKYRDEEAKHEFRKLAEDFRAKLLAEKDVVGPRRPAPEPKEDFRPTYVTKPLEGRRVLAGERLPGMSVAHTGLGLARGELGRRNTKDTKPLFVNDNPREEKFTVIDETV